MMPPLFKGQSQLMACHIQVFHIQHLSGSQHSNGTATPAVFSHSSCRAWGSATAAAGAGRSVSPTAAARPTSKRAPAAAAGDNDGDDDADDAWADRLWQDMQEHRRAAAAAARSRRQSGSTGSTGVFGAGPGRDEAARERERKAAAAAAESARILKEEQAKDADWRAAMMRQVEEVGVACPALGFAVCVACGVVCVGWFGSGDDRSKAVLRTCDHTCRRLQL